MLWGALGSHGYAAPGFLWPHPALNSKQEALVDVGGNNSAFPKKLFPHLKVLTGAFHPLLELACLQVSFRRVLLSHSGLDDFLPAGGGGLCEDKSWPWYSWEACTCPFSCPAGDLSRCHLSGDTWSLQDLFQCILLILCPCMRLGVGSAGFVSQSGSGHQSLTTSMSLQF